MPVRTLYQPPVVIMRSERMKTIPEELCRAHSSLANDHHHQHASSEPAMAKPRLKECAACKDRKK